MNSRLQALNLTDFTGGINVRRNDFNLAENESPRMLNIEVDPRGGFYTRMGWQRWNTVENIGDPTAWEPRNGELHPLSNGSFHVYVAVDDKVWALDPNGNATDLGVPCNASPHLADFAAWGDTMYFACGLGHRVQKQVGMSGVTPLLPALPTDPVPWVADPTIPVGGVVPIAELITAHAGYLFVANTIEEGNAHPLRIRWSLADEPEDFAELDFIDIEEGGGYISALMPFEDHLLIFKPNSVWALYGYDTDSWQLIKVSRTVGAHTPGAVTRSEAAVFFYSGSGRSGIYGWAGEEVTHLSEKLRVVMEEIHAPDDVWLAWTGRRLWCSVPWVPPDIQQPISLYSPRATVFIFDPEVGEGAWIVHRPAIGDLTLIIERSDLSTEHPLACIVGIADQTPMVWLDYRVQASDTFDSDSTAVPFWAAYTTGWQHAGWPDRRKSWRRPRFICREPEMTARIRVDTFWDYQQDTPMRTHTIDLNVEGNTFWRDDGAADPNGWNWGDGTLWGAAESSGASPERPQPAGVIGGLGVKRAIQFRFSSDPSTPGAAWGIDAGVLKYVMRRFTT